MPKARARRQDVDTSHEAAERMNRSGRAATNAEKVLAYIKKYPGCTSAEIAAGVPCLGKTYDAARTEAGRRTADLEKRKLVKKRMVARTPVKRICRIKGTRAVTWWPANHNW